MGEYMRVHDWTSSPLGTPANWPQSLRTVVRLMLNTGHPMYIWWGPELACLYNDAYSQSIGPERHPGSLGKPAREVWGEIWHIIGPQIDHVMSGRGATWNENALVPITRHGRKEEVYWTYSYGPIDDELAPNGVGGVLVVCTETTQAVLAQARQTEAAARQRRLFEQAPGFIIIMRGPDHTVEFVNDAHRAVFGSHNWVGKTIRQAFPSIEGQGFFEVLDRVYLIGETYEATSRPVHYQRSPELLAETRYLTFIYAPLYDDTGAISGIFCEGFDVTEAHHAGRHAAALAELGERIREIVEPDQLAFAAAEILGRELDVSRAGYGTIDPTAETIIIDRDWNAPGIRSLAGTLHFRDYGSYIDELKRGETVVCVDAEIDPRTARNAAALKAISAQSFVNMPVTEEDGFVALLYLNNATPRVWAESEIALIQQIAERTRTAMERRRAEASLRENEGRLRFLAALADKAEREIDADSVMAITTRLVGEHMRVSICAYADMEPDEDHFTIRGDWSAEGSPSIVGHYRLADFGKLAVEKLRAGLPLIVNDNQAELAPEEAQTFINIGIAATICMPLVKEGKLTALIAIHDKNARRWTSSELALLVEVTERSWAHVERGRSEQAAARELAERRRAEQALQALNATLEERVLEEVAERAKAEENLRQSQKMEAVGQLTGGIAHDFNNMLAVVIGGLNLIQRKVAKGDFDVSRFVEGALDGAQRAAGLTQRLLAFSRQQPLAPKPLNINRMVSDMSELLVRTLGETIKVETVLGAGLWQVEVDASQLESAIVNLAVNARDAMPGGGKLTIETSNAYVDDKYAKASGIAAGQFVLIAVTDTGTGMSAETMVRAFDPFYTTKDVGKGTGLGLSQVYGFVRQSSGNVKLYSEVDVGTTVKIYLPRFYGLAADDLRDAGPQVTARGKDDEVILVVEDDDRVRAVSIEALSELGYTVFEMRSPSEALRLLEGDQVVSLLFTDVVMPEMSGRDLVDRARRVRPTLKVLYTTGYTRNAIVHNGALGSGTNLLSKPYSIDELSEKVRAIS